MRKLLAIAALLMGGFLHAQSTSVSATITDHPDNQTWNNGTVTATFVPGPTQAYKWPGGTIPLTVTGAMNGSGTFTISLPDNSTITPIGSAWRFTICPNASAGCQSLQIAVSGASQNLSSQLSAIAQSPRFPAIAGAYGYLDVEISPTPLQGASYFNVTDGMSRQWTGSVWQDFGGGGGTGSNCASVVTNFNAKCDGTTDDSTAIQAAFTSLNTTNSCLNFPVSTPSSQKQCNFSATLNLPTVGIFVPVINFNSTIMHYTGATTAFFSGDNSAVVLNNLDIDMLAATAGSKIFDVNATSTYQYIICNTCSDYFGSSAATWTGATLDTSTSELNFNSAEWISDISGPGQFFDFGSEMYQGNTISSTEGWVNLNETQFYGVPSGTCRVCLVNAGSPTGLGDFISSSVHFYDVAAGKVAVSVASGWGKTTGDFYATLGDSSASAITYAGTFQGNLTACTSAAILAPFTCANYLSSDPYQTCDASIVPTYGRGMCNFTFTSADLLAYDGTIATAVNTVTAPGSGRMIEPDLQGAVFNYVAGATPYTCALCSPTLGFFSPALGSTDLAAYVYFQPDLTQAASQTSYGVPNITFLNFPTTGAANQPLSFYFAGAILTLGNGTVSGHIGYRVMPSN